MHLLLAEVDEPIMLHTFVFLVFLDSPFFLCIRTIMCIVSRFVNILCIHWLFYFLCSFTRFSPSVSFSPALIAHPSLSFLPFSLCTPEWAYPIGDALSRLTTPYDGISSVDCLYNLVLICGL